MSQKLRIANAQGFWGDQVDAAARLLEQEGDIDFLTFDYLAELSLSIMAVQKEKNPHLGYAKDFLDVVRSLLPFWKKGLSFKLITNAGGLNPLELAKECKKILEEAGLSGKTIGLVKGDDALAHLKAGGDYFNLDNQESIKKVRSKLVAANAYIGAYPIVDLLSQGADIVIGGRLADPSMVVGAAAWHFGWSMTDYSKLAQATVAGHLIECGTQVCGGFSTNWLQLSDHAKMSFPLIEMEESGKFVVTKSRKLGGRVNLETVKEQLLYEISDPACYLSPDVKLSFLGLKLEEEAFNCVSVQGAMGDAPTSDYKLSASYRDGYKAEGMLTIVGKDALAKARLVAEVIFERVALAGYELEDTLAEYLGANSVVPGVLPPHSASFEIVLRVAAKSQDKAALERFSKELAPMVTSGPQGVTGYAGGRPKVRPIFAFWPCLIPRDRLVIESQILKD